MRNKHWWLSVFYSLCIQGFVRTTLINLARYFGGNSETLSRASTYLHLAVRLFCAGSGEDLLAQDPVHDTIPIFSPSGIIDTKIAIARHAVQYTTWKERKIQGSALYLKCLFEIDQETLEPIGGSAAGVARAASHPSDASIIGPPQVPAPDSRDHSIAQTSADPEPLTGASQTDGWISSSVDGGTRYPPQWPTMLSKSSRKILTDDDRRRMCQYHEDNPKVKQTEIGGTQSHLPIVTHTFTHIC